MVYLLNRFLQILKNNEEKEINEKDKINGRTFHEFLINFNKNSFHYEINNNFLYKKYSNLDNLSIDVLTNIYESTIEYNELFDSILVHKNQTTYKVVTFIPLNRMPETLNDLTKEQLSFYYYFRQELLKGNFLSKTNINYIYLFLFESVHYQLTNNPGLNISILYRILKHYSKKEEYKELESIIPNMIYNLLMEINEPFLAAEFTFIHNNESLIKEFKQPKDFFELKKYNKYIHVYEELEYMKYRKRTDKLFKDILIEYLYYKNVSLYNLFIKTSQQRVHVFKRPFLNLKSNRLINTDEAYKITYFIKENFSELLTDLYKLAYHYSSNNSVDYYYLENNDINYLLGYLKEKNNMLINLVSKPKDETVKEDFIQRLINKQESTVEEKLSPEKEQYKKLIRNALNYNSFKVLFEEKSYFEEIHPDLLKKHELIPIDEIPDFLYMNYFKTIQFDKKTSFFYQLLNYRIHQDDIKSHEQYQTILEYGISYINLLKEEQRHAYLSFRKEVLNNHFIPYVHVSYIYLLLSECMHLNLSSNPHFIMNLLDKILEHYSDKLNIEIQIAFYKQAFLKECLLEDKAKQFELSIPKNEAYKDLFFKEKILTTQLEKLTISSFKKYIVNYDKLEMPAKVRTKTNRYFKEVLLYINELKENNLILSYKAPHSEIKKVMKPYKKLELYRLTPEVYYYETYEKFDIDSFSEFITHVYLFVYHYVNETSDDVDIEFEYLDESLQFLNSKYKKIKTEKIEEKETVMVTFNLDEIEELKKLHGVEKEEDKEIKLKKSTNNITKEICIRFLSLFNDDECSLKDAESFAREYKLPLNKLISETNKQCNTSLTVEDDMIYND